MNGWVIFYTIFLGIVVFAMCVAMIFGAQVFWKEYRLKGAAAFFCTMSIVLMSIYWIAVVKAWFE